MSNLETVLQDLKAYQHENTYEQAKKVALTLNELGWHLPKDVRVLLSTEYLENELVQKIINKEIKHEHEKPSLLNQYILFNEVKVTPGNSLEDRLYGLSAKIHIKLLKDTESTSSIIKNL